MRAPVSFTMPCQTERLGASSSLAYAHGNPVDQVHNASADALGTARRKFRRCISTVPCVAWPNIQPAVTSPISDSAWTYSGYEGDRPVFVQADQRFVLAGARRQSHSG